MKDITFEIKQKFENDNGYSKHINTVKLRRLYKFFSCWINQQRNRQQFCDMKIASINANLESCKRILESRF